MPATVLVVDDHSGLRDMLRFVIGTDRRYTLAGEASDGVEAVDAARRLQPQVIILDESMPALSGSAAIAALRRAAPGALIIGYSGDSSGELIGHLDAELDAYVRKGSSVHSLLELVATLLERRRHWQVDTE